MKAKFDAQKFLLLHCEKIALGVFLGLVGLLVWNAVSLEPYTRTPVEMDSQAQRLTQVVNEAKWEEYLKEKEKLVPPTPAEGNTTPNVADLPIRRADFQSEAALSFRPVPAPPISALDPPVDRPSTRRKTPTLFAMTNLEASHGFGAFALVGGGAPTTNTPATSAAPPARPKRSRAAGVNTFRSIYPGAAPGVIPPPAGGRPPAGPPGGAEGMMPGGSGGGGRRPPGPPGVAPPGGGGAYPGMIPGMEGYGTNLSAANLDQVQVRGYQWVCVSGVVPFTRQQLEFFDKLAVTSQNVQPADYVQYTNFEVRRAEVKSENDQPKPEDWVSLDLSKLIKEMENWAPIEQPEVVNQVCLYPGLSSPLPPRVDRVWTKDVVHTQFYDYLLNDADAFKQAEAAAKALDAAKPADDSGRTKNPFKQFGAEGGLTYGESGAAGLPPGYGRRGTGVGAGLVGGAEGGGEVKIPDSRMFRFFDFTVEEGKSYVYSVRLEVANPNFGLGEKVLDRVDAGKPEFLFTEWSPVSPVRSIPKSSNVLVAGVSKDRRSRAQPLLGATSSRDARVDVMVRQWNREHGTMTSKIFGMLRGQVANYTNEQVTLIKPGTVARQDAQVSFKTGLALVDFIGGTKIKPGRDYLEPCEMAFTDASGKLYIRNELADRAEFQAEEARIAPPVTDVEGTTTTDEPLFGAGLESDLLNAPKPGAK